MVTQGPIETDGPPPGNQALKPPPTSDQGGRGTRAGFGTWKDSQTDASCPE